MEVTRITTTLGALVQAEAALAAICALKLSAKSAYHLKKLTQIVAIETQHFHTERDRYITDLGTAREAGGFELKPDSDQMPIFVAKVTELLAVPVELAWGPITLAMLGDEKVSAAELTALGPLVADPDGEIAP
jgi:hypothetical protein